MRKQKRRPTIMSLMGLMVVMLVSLVIAACSSGTAETQVVRETTEGSGQFTTPHPILGDIRVRQAIAYCVDRTELIQSVYPFLDDEQRASMVMDTFIPQGHWAYTDEGITKYPFDPEQGKQLLEEAGWQEVEEGYPRENDAGDALALKYTTTDAQFRITYSTVLEQQLLENCGIQIVRTHAPGSWWFGGSTGLQRRDFELGAFAWVGQADPGGNTLYSCNQIPIPNNGWEGQNYMGWCNEAASQAIIMATNTLERDERKEYYAITQQEFTKDMVSLPLFNRFEAAVTTNNLNNFAADVSEVSYTVNAHEWELADGGDTVVLGFSQEPASLFTRREDLSVAQIIADLMTVRAATGKGYDYQPVALTELPTLESGQATLEVVDVQEGDMVWTALAEAEELAPGVEVIHADGDIITYEGGTIEMEQITVNFEVVEGLTWEDGEPVTKEDMELAQRINCDPDIQATSYLVCESLQDVAFTSDTTFTRTYLPGAKTPEYMVYTQGTNAGTGFTLGAYPAHQELADGRTLADVPAAEWINLPEIAEKSLSYGPYRLVEWQKGQRMVFEANPHYYLGEPIVKTIIAQFFGDTNAAVAQLLTGDVDVLGSETLGGGQELGTVIEAGASGKVTVIPITSSTWEHIDMNLFVK